MTYVAMYTTFSFARRGEVLDQRAAVDRDERHRAGCKEARRGRARDARRDLRGLGLVVELRAVPLDRTDRRVVGRDDIHQARARVDGDVGPLGGEGKGPRPGARRRAAGGGGGGIGSGINAARVGAGRRVRGRRRVARPLVSAARAGPHPGPARPSGARPTARGARRTVRQRRGAPARPAAQGRRQGLDDREERDEPRSVSMGPGHQGLVPGGPADGSANRPRASSRSAPEAQTLASAVPLRSSLSRRSSDSRSAETQTRAIRPSRSSYSVMPV